jgi:hypothetical protein
MTTQETNLVNEYLDKLYNLKDIIHVMETILKYVQANYRVKNEWLQELETLINQYNEGLK